MKVKPIYFIFCYARSGGTFLNRYLANFNEFIILSEAHPIHNSKGGIYSVKTQMKEWYGIDVQSDDYINQIIEVKEWCDNNNKYLLIRDWSFIDFSYRKLNNQNPPLQPVNLKLLEKKFTINKIAYVRDGIDIVLSQGQSIKSFSKEYLNYVQYLISNKISCFKYEDFIKNPEVEVEKICGELGISRLKHQPNIGVTSNKVIGDVNMSRGNQNNSIVILKRRYAGCFKRIMINRNENLIEANRLLNYPAFYQSQEHESFLSYFMFEKRVLVNKIKKMHKLYKSKNIDD